MNHVTVSVRKLSGIEPILNEMGLEKQEIMKTHTLTQKMVRGSK